MQCGTRDVRNIMLGRSTIDLSLEAALSHHISILFHEYHEKCALQLASLASKFSRQRGST